MSDDRRKKSAKLLARIDASIKLLQEAGLADAKRIKAARVLKNEIKIACERSNTFGLALLGSEVIRFECKVGYEYYEYQQKEKEKKAAAMFAALFNQS